MASCPDAVLRNLTTRMKSLLLPIAAVADQDIQDLNIDSFEPVKYVTLGKFHERFRSELSVITDHTEKIVNICEF